ncbi:C40 family peptidase [Arthrobacter sp. GCM10027362]|uniref:C40 family peptidase n=1 Tax=Arthrobacter sp. GCM10027362 TaxID=3273379 RepID=UPI003643B3BD
MVAAAAGLLVALGVSALAAPPVQAAPAHVLLQEAATPQPPAASVQAGIRPGLERVSAAAKALAKKKAAAIAKAAKKKAKAKAAKKKAATAHRIVSIARTGIGRPYAWGGTGPRGWDCSGFVRWVHAKAGIELPRVRQWTVMKRTSEPKPGDLVVQNGGSHVGIYTGRGRMISALGTSLGTRAHPVSWMPARFYTLA